MVPTDKDAPEPESPPGADSPLPPEFDFAVEDGDEEIQDFADLDLPEDDAAPASVRRGAAVIRSFWRQAPQGPGVYRMIAADGEVLYVGKAKSVRKRIASYMRPLGHNNRIARMIALTASMVFISTSTETEALLLETNYIKQMKPRFNVLMRDDKSFPYILLTGDHAAPQILKHRGARNRKGDYFGPFASVWAVNRTMNALERAFLLRSCSDSYYENRTRPCLLHQIKRCSAPCTGEIDLDDYRRLVGEARDFLSGKSRAVRDLLATEMTSASDALEFERAARLRDRIAALSAIQGAQGVNPKTVEEADVFAIVEEAGQFCVEAFFFRTYQNWGNRAYFPRADKSLASAEVLDAFLAQFYADKPAPRLILLSHEIENGAVLSEALSLRTGHRIEIARPQRGEKHELVEHACQNAREAMSRRLSETASQEKLLAALAAALGLSAPLRRVEIYDNSHIMGTNAVGAMVVAGPAGFMKAHYRTFNIKGEDLTPGDDYGMMREVLRRRFLRLAKDEAAADGPSTRDDDEDIFPQRPDLILIDGGQGQFDAANAILDELSVTGVAVAGIAKGVDRNAGRESFFVAGKAPFRLSPRDPALYFVQRLRDEAHRFAIGTHRARRKKEFTRSPLDEIAGVGPARKRALLHAFGTAKAISKAALSDLEKVAGVNAATARLVYNYFHEGGG
ncbi:excinuclease ABC, C subunit [Methylocella silvestris BL2]|uniref:UvrABC system protein C n=1 Tax=Methylocella silvestris (strain DSM 15510 / CIP 108128 / LMG 27833 / NCIMB 13906 / BL2) TaxID=395965 RepID=B8ESR3_METSB|nr:excinuclease ABC subunit UvrC [Methylocella silvestris]ACK50398.1 excinuclease ABC, C subunit [Methylocella silvestris BL2]